MRRDFEAVMEKYGGKRLGIKSDLARSGKKWRKENREEEGSSSDFRGYGGKLYDSPQPEPDSTHVQGFMLLMKKLCPVEATIYPGFNGGNDGEIRSMAEPSENKIMADCDEEEEAKSKHKGNKRGNIEVEIIELLDVSDEEAIMEIPVEVSRRPPSEYKDRLIEELKRPFDKCEYRELMNKSTLRTKKIVEKELRLMEKALETAPRIRVRSIETGEDSKSFFDWYPGLERKIKMARSGRRLILLRGFFFWLQNAGWVLCCTAKVYPNSCLMCQFTISILVKAGRSCSQQKSTWEQSFKPWHKGRKRIQDTSV